MSKAINVFLWATVVCQIILAFIHNSAVSKLNEKDEARIFFTQEALETYTSEKDNCEFIEDNETDWHIKTPCTIPLEKKPAALLGAGIIALAVTVSTILINNKVLK